MIHFYMIRFYINTACAVRHLIIFTAPFKGAARIFGDLALNALRTVNKPLAALPGPGEKAGLK